MKDKLPFTNLISEQLDKELSKERKNNEDKVFESSNKSVDTSRIPSILFHHKLTQPETRTMNPRNVNQEVNLRSSKENSSVIMHIKAKVSLVGIDRILIKPSNRAIATVLSRTQNSYYDIKNNEWFFILDHYPTVSSELAKLGVIFETIPQGTLKMVTKKISDNCLVLKGGIYDKLFSFQKEAVNFAVNRDGRVLLADDMGLGKTIQALAIASYYQRDFPLLIISPASLLGSWNESVERFLGIKPNIIRSKPFVTSSVSIISYSHATSFHEDIVRLKPGIIICDECHYLKSMNSKRSKQIIPLLQKSLRLIMISGTPALSRPLELYPIFMALDRTIYPNFGSYGTRYCNGRKIGRFFDYRGSSNAKELGIALEHAFMIRRMKNVVLKELPTKSRRQIILSCERKGQNLKDVTKLERAISDAMSEGSQENTIITEFADAAKIKKPYVLEYIQMLLEKGLKIVVFAHHQEMLSGLKTFCENKKYKHIKIDGSTPTPKRHAMVEDFQKDAAILVAILSITACSTGITLTAANVVVFAELYWNPGTLLQAEDRIHRIGQKSNVDIHYIVAKKTVDEFVWPHILKKLNVLESLGIGKNELKYVKSEEEDLDQKRLDNYFSKKE